MSKKSGGNNGRLADPGLNIHTCAYQKNYDDLHDRVKNYFNIVSPTSCALLSTADSDAMELLQTTCKKINGRFEVDLLWKNSDAKLPDSYDNAYRRLMCLNKKLVKDDSLGQSMQIQIDNLIEEGYAKKLSPDELEVPNKKAWYEYLPIFLTLNLNKPNKMRLVWDTAAK